MEFTTSYTNHDDLAEATRGLHGKDIGKDYKIVAVENIIIGFAENTEILDKHVAAKHDVWTQIGNNVYITILK